MTTIISAVDDTSEARAAARLASQLAERLSCQLILAHAVPALATSRGGSHRTVEAGERLLEHIAREEHLIPADHHVAAVSSRAQFLLDLSEHTNAALVVLGTRRRGVLSRALNASVSRVVAARAGCPVIIVPAGPPPAEFKAIICGINHDHEAQIALHVARVLARQIGAQLIIAHVVPPTPGGLGALATEIERSVWDDAKQLISQLAASEGLGLDTPQRILAGDACSALTSLARREAADLIVIGRPSERRITATVLGSVSRTLPTIAVTPVMLVPAVAATPALPIRKHVALGSTQ